VLLMLSGPAASAPSEVPAAVEVVRSETRLGFSAAVNRGLERLAGALPEVAILNDDALPCRDWLEVLGRALADDPGLAAVQGTVSDASGGRVDGRGIAFDRWGLPVQIDRGAELGDSAPGTCQVLAVSGTAALFRQRALHEVALGDGSIFDPAFGSYHEDLDLGLRLGRLGWRAAWVGGARCRHLGSATGTSFAWRHPRWLLVNRWRALAGNLSRRALITATPRLLRGELRAIRTLARHNPRTLVVALWALASWPAVVYAGWRRTSAGPRLPSVPATPR
jgi:GT2 family glycosyltransferase